MRLPLILEAAPRPPTIPNSGTLSAPSPFIHSPSTFSKNVLCLLRCLALCCAALCCVVLWLLRRLCAVGVHLERFVIRYSVYDCLNSPNLFSHFICLPPLSSPKFRFVSFPMASSALEVAALGNAMYRNTAQLPYLTTENVFRFLRDAPPAGRATSATTAARWTRFACCSRM